MKKVSFMKLNIQQENLLSKEEKKKLLGGYGPYPCYVTCNSNVGTFGVNSCNSSDTFQHCQTYGVSYCICH